MARTVLEPPWPCKQPFHDRPDRRGRPDRERQVGPGAAPGRSRARRDHQRRQHAAVPRSAPSHGPPYARGPGARAPSAVRHPGCRGSGIGRALAAAGGGGDRRGAGGAAARDRGRRHRAVSACPAAWPGAGSGHPRRRSRRRPGAARRAGCAGISCRARRAGSRDGRAPAPDRSPAAAARVRGRRRHRALACSLAGDAAAARRVCRRAAAASLWCRRGLRCTSASTGACAT